MPPRLPELLAPAGSLDAVRAAVANGADAVYLGVERFNARDEGAQLTLDELDIACAMAHGRGARVYLTLNTLLKPGELVDALMLLGDAIDRGIDAAIVQDVGLVRLAQRLYPGFELHGSTQMTVHDIAGATVLRDLGVPRVVLARESTLEDIRAIRQAVPELELESFVHGALCISYSGQCLMSGMISERSANRGSCAQSCRKDYVLRDAASGDELDRGFLISARDLAAVAHLESLVELGIVCLKVEGRKKRPEYVATVSRQYRAALDRIARGEPAALDDAARSELLQIYSRGFTGGMYGGRAGRDYVTRSHPDNRGVPLGLVVGRERGDLVVEVSAPVEPGDGLAFEPPSGTGETTGFIAGAVRTIGRRAGVHRQAIPARASVPIGWRVLRTSHAALLARARASFAAIGAAARARRTRLDVRAFGGAGAPLKLVFTANGESVTVRSEQELTPARTHALGAPQLREHLRKLGETPFALGDVDVVGLAAGLFLPVSELNHLRQEATERLLLARDWANEARLAERRGSIERAVSELAARQPPVDDSPPFVLAADVFRIEDAVAAAAAGATEVSLDPFLRHPVPPRARVRAMAEELAGKGVTVRLRTPTVLRPTERHVLDKWLALGLPILSGHLGLVAELARAGCDVVADYAVNCFNQHTASCYFALGARRIVLSVELTADEMAELTAPWSGTGFDVLVYGRPEGMTIEHCVLSAAYDREPTTCRDLCVRDHPLVELTDPSGYVFPVATDSACRNRLLHSRPIEGSEFVPRLWANGVRAFRLLFNMPGDPVAELVARHREMLERLTRDERPDHAAVRAVVGSAFTRGHFARAV